MEHKNEKKEPRKRDRTEYMKKYYQSRKQVVTCPSCNKEFASPSSLRHHENHSMHCMVSRLQKLWGDARNEFPSETERVEPLLQQELNRIRNLNREKNTSAENMS